MKIVLAADGSPFTKKALAFLVTHEQLLGAEDELIVVHVQPVLTPRVKTMLGAEMVAAHHRDEAERVLAPIRAFLDRHEVRYRCKWLVDQISRGVIKTATAEKAHLLIVGTHGHGLLGRALMGSVAQRVIADSDIPVLLIK